MSRGDYHVHTNFSIDSEAIMEEQCRAAIAEGITEIAFTEHVDHDSCDQESIDHYNIDAYRAEIERCRELFDGQLHILQAAEVDWNHTIVKEVEAFVTTNSFDFIIGSVHNLDHRYVGFFPVEDFGGPRSMYDAYFNELSGLVNAGVASVIGHADLPRRYHGISPLDVDREHFEGRYREIFRNAARKGVGFELNTSLIRKGTYATHPEPDVIQWFVEEGGEVITIGSDSHRPADTGHSIQETERRLIDLGIDWRTSFVGGVGKKVKLSD